jgi:hypothetical protein
VFPHRICFRCSRVVDLKENEFKKLELPLIAADEIQQIYSRLDTDTPPS